jgi:hypothetical protein
MLPERLSLSLLRSTTILLALLLVNGVNAHSSLAAEDNTDSLESLWNDHTAEQTLVPSNPNNTTSSKSVDTAAPLCSLEELKAGAIMQKSWPGIGPFTAGAEDPQNFTDPAQNHIHLNLADNQVTKAELSLLKDKPSATDFLDIQMSANFFLEGLGVKPPAIAAFNQEM